MNFCVSWVCDNKKRRPAKVVFFYGYGSERRSAATLRPWTTGPALTNEVGNLTRRTQAYYTPEVLKSQEQIFGKVTHRTAQQVEFCVSWVLETQKAPPCPAVPEAPFRGRFTSVCVLKVTRPNFTPRTRFPSAHGGDWRGGPSLSFFSWGERKRYEGATAVAPCFPHEKERRRGKARTGGTERLKHPPKHQKTRAARRSSRPFSFGVSGGIISSLLGGGLAPS